MVSECVLYLATEFNTFKSVFFLSRLNIGKKQAKSRNLRRQVLVGTRASQLLVSKFLALFQ